MSTASLSDYQAFLSTKQTYSAACGFEVADADINPMLFPFQRDIVRWSCHRGKAAVFAHTGLGKGPIQLEWCRLVGRHTGGNTLILAPLAVSQQFMREAAKFHIPLTLCKSQADVKPGINVTNYERTDLFDLESFSGVALDESSCIKDWTSKTTAGLIERLRNTPYKLCSTATPSPNDHAELGTHAELLDVMKRSAMLAMFFEHDGGETSKWALKGHGKKPFWKFVASWAVCLNKPSDLGYDDSLYILPKLHTIEHIVPVDHSVNTEGMLFRSPDLSATGLHKELRLTCEARAERVVELVRQHWDSTCKTGKVSTWDGSRNTKSTDAPGSTQTLSTRPDSESNGNETGELPKRTPSICANTTQPTSISGLPDGSGIAKQSIPESGSSTHPILQSANTTNPSPEPGRATIQKGRNPSASDNTGSRLSSSMHSSNPKTESAPSVDSRISPNQNYSLLSTIATTQDESGVSSAPTAISASESSGTIRDCYLPLSPISPLEKWIVWCNTNYEQKPLLARFGDLCISIDGSMSPDEKEKRILRWLDGERPILLTKPSVAGFGLNFQCCHNVAFVGLGYSFEAVFQAIRRCWRFGQTQEVYAHIVIAETEGAVLSSIRRKEAQYEELQREMNEAMREEQLAARHKSAKYDHTVTMMLPDNFETEGMEPVKVIDQYVADEYAIYHSDCVEMMKGIPDNSVHLSISSPPFGSLYSYTDAREDMSNVRTDREFIAGMEFMVAEMARILMPGRICAFHCMNLPSSIERDGFIGIRDFRGDLIRLYQRHGFIYHSEVVIWKDPLVAATRTHAIGLAHKQIVSDSAICRVGIPDYLIAMRKPGKNPEPVSPGVNGFQRWIGAPEDEPKAEHRKDARTNKYSHLVWQKYASPVWFDINPSDTLQKQSAREDEDSRHICPLQLTVIRRAIELWSNPGDIVFDPFSGIGSSGYVALEERRCFLGAELKESYYRQACGNLKAAVSLRDQGTLYG